MRRGIFYLLTALFLILLQLSEGAILSVSAEESLPPSEPIQPVRATFDASKFPRTSERTEGMRSSSEETKASFEPKPTESPTPNLPEKGSQDHPKAFNSDGGDTLPESQESPAPEPIEEKPTPCLEPLPEESLPPFSEKSPLNQPPVAIIDIQQSGSMKLNVTGEKSYDPEGEKLSFSWQGDEGFQSARKNPGEHVFSSPGLKTITLTVTDPQGAWNKTSLAFNAQEKPGLPRPFIESQEEQEEEESYPVGAVTLERVLPNPSGPDTDQEEVVLKNHLSQTIDLQGWHLEDAQGHRTDLKDFLLLPEAFLTLRGKEIGFSLNNSQESLHLYDARGQNIDTLRWEKAAAGQWIFPPDRFSEGMEAQVTQVIDGDSVILDFGEALFIESRLLGVDAPELGPKPKPYSAQAQQVLEELLLGQTVTLEFEPEKWDNYGRLLTYVFLPNGSMANAQLLKQGYAKAYTRFPFQYVEEFLGYEQDARQAGRGLWEKPPKNEKKLKKALKKEEAFALGEGAEEAEAEIWTWQDAEFGVEETEDQGDLNSSDTPENKTEILFEDCAEGELQIEAFLPSPPKGEEEWIRLINAGEEPLCLFGWQLDDALHGGSRPFALPAQDLSPGESHTFYKSETKLNLNNKEDTVRLLDPWGQVVDAIEYGRAHPGEIFTHEGGNWLPKKAGKKPTTMSQKKESTKKKASSKSNKRHSFDRERIAYQSEWANEVVVGALEWVSANTLAILTPEGKRLLASFDPAQIDWEMVELLGEAGPWEFQLRQDKSGRTLVALSPVKEEEIKAASFFDLNFEQKALADDFTTDSKASSSLFHWRTLLLFTLFGFVLLASRKRFKWGKD